MIIFTALFAGLMLLSAHSRRRIIAISPDWLSGNAVIAPAPAQGQLLLPAHPSRARHDQQGDRKLAKRRQWGANEHSETSTSRSSGR